MNDNEKYVFGHTLEEIENMTEEEREIIRQRLLIKYGNLKDDIDKQFDKQSLLP